MGSRLSLHETFIYISENKWINKWIMSIWIMNGLESFIDVVVIIHTVTIHPTQCLSLFFFFLSLCLSLTKFIRRFVLFFFFIRPQWFPDIFVQSVSQSVSQSVHSGDELLKQYFNYPKQNLHLYNICVSIYLFIFLFVKLYIYKTIYISIYLYIYLSI